MTEAKLHVASAGEGQLFLVATPMDDKLDAATACYTLINEALERNGMAVVHERIFGSLEAFDAVRAARSNADDDFTYIQGTPLSGSGLAGIQIQAVARDLIDTSPSFGKAWQRHGVSYLMLQNIQGRPGLDRQAQAEDMFSEAERRLRDAGLEYRNVVRTWIYLSKILAWYDDFNKSRNGKYHDLGLLPVSSGDELLLPASTGIEGDAPGGTACVMDLLAASSGAPIRQLSNPGQEDAFQYGSAFSRGLLIEERDVSLIHVSGTAAIDEAGTSLHQGDASAQIACTFDKIGELLGTEGAGIEQICAATAFVKHADHAALFREAATARGLNHDGCICVRADVCRDELLFEMEAVAAVDR